MVAIVRTVPTCIYWAISPKKGVEDYEDPFNRSLDTEKCRYDEYYGIPTEIAEEVSTNLLNIEKYITCFNGGECNGYGTCRACNRYDFGIGLHASHIYNPKEGFPLQLPLNFQIFNLQATIQKCCNWRGAPQLFTMANAPAGIVYLPDKLNGPISQREDALQEISGIVVGGWVHAETGATFIIDTRTGRAYYLKHGEDYSSDSAAAYRDAFAENGTLCILKEDADDWNAPKHGGSDFDGSQPCNGARTDCPYYTGPQWQYARQDALEGGHYITAKQIQELRYYSDYWKRYRNPEQVFNKTFSTPIIWSWDDIQYLEEDNPNYDSLQPEHEIYNPQTVDVLALAKVYISDFDTGQIAVEEEVEIGAGTDDDVPTGQANDSPPDYPTLISEIFESFGRVKILYPTYEYPDLKFNYRHFIKDRNYTDIILKAPVGSRLYVFNSNFINTPFNFDSADDIAVISDDKKEEIGKFFTSDKFISLWQQRSIYGSRAVVKNLAQDDLEYVHLSTSTGTGIELEYNKDNKIFVYCLNSNGRWSFEEVIVRYEFLHAFTSQTSFDGGSSDFEGIDLALTSPRWRGQIETIGNTYLKNFIWLEKEGIASDYDEIEELEKTTVVDDWSLLNCGKILIRIDDTDVSRVNPYRRDEANKYNQWELISATVDFYSRDTGTARSVEYELDYVNYDGFGLPANYAILKTKEDEEFDGSPSPDSIVTISYKVYLSKQKAHPLDISFNDLGFNVQRSGLHHNEMLCLAEFADKDDRLIGRKVFKLISAIREVWCRDVEIFYQWKSLVTRKQAVPSLSRIISSKANNGFDFVKAGSSYETRYAQCGDHDLRSFGWWAFTGNKVGPMFYPYSECGIPFYQNRDINFQEIVRPIPGKTEADERYQGIPDSRPRTLDTHFVIWTCMLDYTYGNLERAPTNLFSGIAIARGPLSYAELLKYQVLGWTAPKFGNKGREMTRLTLTLEREGCGDGLHKGTRWIPAVITNPSTELVTDAFSEDLQSPLNSIVSNSVFGRFVNEKVNENARYTYDQLFIKSFSSCATCKPLLETGRHPVTISGSFYTGHYFTFTDPDIMWAWRENERGISRDSNVDNIIGAVSCFVPPYVYPGDYDFEPEDDPNGIPPDVASVLSYGWTHTGEAHELYDATAVPPEYIGTFWRVDKEIRIRPEEGYHLLKFKPPNYDASGVLDGEYGFQLDDGPIREVDFETLQILNNGIYINVPDLPESSLLALYDSDNTSPGNLEGSPRYIYISFTGEELPTSTVNSLNDGRVDLQYKYDVVPSGIVYESAGNFYISGRPTYQDNQWINATEKGLITGSTGSGLDDLIAGWSGKVVEASDGTKLSAQLGEAKIYVEFSRPIMVEKIEVEYALGSGFMFPGATIYGRKEDSSQFDRIGIIYPHYPTSKQKYNVTKEEKDSGEISGYNSYKEIYVSLEGRVFGWSAGLFSMKIYNKEFIEKEETIFINERKYYVSTGDYGMISYGENGNQKSENGATFQIDAPNYQYNAYSKTRGEAAGKQYVDKEETRTTTVAGAVATKLEGWQAKLFEDAKNLTSGSDSSFRSYFVPDDIAFMTNTLKVSVPSWELNVDVQAEDISAYGEIIPSSVWNFPGYAVCHGGIGREVCWLSGRQETTFRYYVISLSNLEECGPGAGQPLALSIYTFSYVTFGGLVPSYAYNVDQAGG